ncbi:restriction endonuclease subunit S [Pseudoalteromonas sp. C2R02]|uniref:restriction endonuclease subunit S n=1 Tax=Pseudoalteromonas sp. C2R02 TaxID=2841565 RepID=UPI001C0A0A3B|nr:restriction endonuclease subunit S [Pseudoalteromonas sp. C2R02]MBU2969222.1 restriction endonuclease subunit S [Pseudoalteromonas sp. C2R02]
MNKTLSDIAIVKAGHPFRGKIPEEVEGSAFVVQIRDIDNDGIIHWHQLIRTNITGRKNPDWLQKGDVIFAARGERNLAGFVGDIDRPTVCAPHYFLIKVTDKSVLPEFIAWQLNQDGAQRYFANSAEGSAQTSIRRAVLEATPLVIPNIEKQNIIVEFDNKVKQEKHLLNALIDNRSKQMQGIAKELLDSGNQS